MSFTFHLDRPVQIESTPATVLFALGGSDVTGTNLRPDRFKSNGLDGGDAPQVARLFALLLVAALAWIVALAAAPRRPPPRAVRLRGAARVRDARQGLLAAVRHLARPVRGARGRLGPAARRGLVAAAIVLTHVEFPSRYFDLINVKTDVVLVVAARNVLLAALAVLISGLARRTDIQR